MTFTNTQTKLGQAITTNASGDYAVRTIIEGDQTLGNLAVGGTLGVTGLTSLDGGLGADLDAKGNYILNDQTTTNMMNKGTVYRFNGVDDLITVSSNAAIADIFSGGGFIKAEIYPLSDGEANEGRIVEKFGAAAGWLLYTVGETDGNVALQFKRGAASSDGVWISAVVIPIATWSTIEVDYNDATPSTPPTMRLNGIPISLTTSTAPVGAVGSDSAVDMKLGNSAAGSRTFDGEISEVMLGNFIPSQNEVKDLVSGNIPFKWQYGSQTELITDGIFANWTGDNPDNWTDASTPTVTKDTSDPYSGTNCLQMVCTSQEGIYSDAFTALEVGKNISTSLAVKRTAGAGNLEVFLRVGAGGGVTAVMPLTVTNEWAVYDITFESIAVAATMLWIRTQSGNEGTFLIDAVSTVKQGAVALYDQTSITANNWFDLANGNTGAVTGASVLNPKGIATDEDNIPNFSITSGITADTGSAQGNGVLTSSINQISVCANAGDAVTLPSAKPGKVLWVVNDGANASDVFPASGDNIDEAGANTAKSLPADGEMQFICTSAGHWSTITSA